ncbi:MAG: hypothetical protein V1743_02625 [Nanoarchaeota archaeon]
MKNKKQILIIIIAVVLVGIVLISCKSMQKIQPKIPENTSEIPVLSVVIGNSTYPELIPYEKAIHGSYELLFKNYSREIGRQFECPRPPELSVLTFRYLRPRQTLYMISSSCELSGGDTRGYGIPPILFFITGGTVEMFFQGNITTHFMGAFDRLESADQAREYSELYIDSLSIDLAASLNDSFFHDYTSQDFEKDCPFNADVPVLNDTVFRRDADFLYHGFAIEPEFHARMYYRAYTISPDGTVRQDSESMLALCKNIGIIY